MSKRFRIIFSAWPIRPIAVAVLLALFQVLVNSATVIASAREQGQYAHIEDIFVTFPSIVLSLVFGVSLLWLIDSVSKKFTRIATVAYWIGGLLYGQTMALSRLLSINDQTPAFWADVSSWLRLSLVTAIFYFVVHITLGLSSYKLQEQVLVARAAKASLEVQRGKLITAQEEVRKQIADFLHDRLQSDLVVLGMQMQRSIENLGESEKSIALAYIDEIERIRQFDVRGISRQLAPELDGPSFRPAIEELVERYQKVFSVDLQITETGELNKPLKLACFRIIEQALMNAAQHANATQVRIEVRELNTGVRVSIANNGEALAKNPVSGAGFATIETWVSHFSGSWSLTSKEGWTELEATLAN